MVMYMPVRYIPRACRRFAVGRACYSLASIAWHCGGIEKGIEKQANCTTETSIDDTIK